jgi:hypothetical protein
MKFAVEYLNIDIYMVYSSYNNFRIRHHSKHTMSSRTPICEVKTFTAKKKYVYIFVNLFCGNFDLSLTCVSKYYIDVVYKDSGIIPKIMFYMILLVHYITL